MNKNSKSTSNTRSECGRGLAKGTKVLLYEGTLIPVERVRIGSLLMGSDSRPRKVISITDKVKAEAMMKVIPIKGESFVCTQHHILTLVQSVTSEIFDVRIGLYLKIEHRFRDCKLLRAGVGFSAEKVWCDPYLLGLWLGDGSKDWPIITNPEPIIQDYCKQAAFLHGCEAVVTFPENKCGIIRFRIREKTSRGHRMSEKFLLRDFFRTCYQNDEKRIPLAYLVNSRTARLQLLAGIIDTDGHRHSPNGYEIVTKYDGLKDDLLFLARSLGYSANATVKVATIKSLNFERNYWRISISGDTEEVPCKVPRKQAQPRKQIKDVLRTGFSVEELGEDKYYGFTLNGDGRFLLGDFTVTRSSSIIS